MQKMSMIPSKLYQEPERAQIEGRKKDANTKITC